MKNCSCLHEPSYIAVDDYVLGQFFKLGEKSMDSLAKLKADLLAELGVQYKNLVTSLRAMPVAQEFKSPGFMNLDQGLMWFEKGIHLLQLQTATPESPVVKDCETVLDGVVQDTQC